MGTNWHAMHEVYGESYRTRFEQYTTHSPEDAVACAEECKDFALEEVIAHLNTCYAEVPSWLTAEEWALERQILLTSFIGYL